MPEQYNEKLESILPHYKMDFIVKEYLFLTKNIPW